MIPILLFDACFIVCQCGELKMQYGAAKNILFQVYVTMSLPFIGMTDLLVSAMSSICYN